MRWIVFIGMGAALTLVLGGGARPSPASIVPGSAEVAGVHRITRHPVFMGIGLFGLVHLLGSNVHGAELAFFGGFLVFALAGCAHQDRRKLATGGEDFRSFYDQTPFLPFTGPGTVTGLAEMRIPIAIGVVSAVVLRWFHPQLFGGM